MKERVSFEPYEDRDGAGDVRDRDHERCQTGEQPSRADRAQFPVHLHEV